MLVNNIWNNKLILGFICFSKGSCLGKFILWLRLLFFFFLFFKSIGNNNLIINIWGRNNCLGRILLWLLRMKKF